MTLVAFPDTNTTIFIPHTVLQHTVLEHTVLQQTGALDDAKPGRRRQGPEVVTRPPVRTRSTIIWAGASSGELTAPSAIGWVGVVQRALDRRP